MILHFDDEQMIRVAKAVIRFNKYAKGYTVEDMVEDMKSCAYQTFSTRCDGYVCTRGYVLTGYNMHGDTDRPGHVYASISVDILDD